MPGRFLVLLLVALPLIACGNAPGSPSGNRLLFIGQDLDAIRGYLDSECCVAPDGLTAYVSFYNILAPEFTYGGLGINADGEALTAYADWGSGPKHALETATGYGVDHLAMGLTITENEHPGALDRLLAGAYDANIAQLAQFAAKVRGNVYLRLGYEFDGAWNQGYEQSERFVRAYRHIVDGLRAHGADNILTVWQASAASVDDIIDGGHEDIRDWYPGDEYVDWLGFSWFMHPELRPTAEVAWMPPTPRELAREVIDLAEELGKPVMIAEAAPQAFDLARATKRNHSPLWDGPAGENVRRLSPEDIWQAWYQPLFDLMASEPSIRALAYINCNWDVQPMWGAPYESGYWGDTRLEVNPIIAERFNQALANWRDHAQSD